MASVPQKFAERDPVPTFLQSFYNNEVGKEARGAGAGPRSRFACVSAHKGEEAGAALEYRETI